METDLDILADALRNHVRRLAATPREPRTPAHHAAADYVRTHLTRAGFAVEEQTFGEGGAAGRNLLTRPVPDRPDLPLLVIGAHYDSIPGSPGADDNASAVAALLELARWLGPRLTGADKFGARLQLAAYDLEEYGLLGSLCHSRELRANDTRLRGMISLEMLGYTDGRPGSQNLPPRLKHLYPDVGNFIGVVGNEASASLLEAVVRGMQTVPGLPVECLEVPGAGHLVPAVRLSDHASFWDNGFPALMVTDTSFFRNPHYHQATDTPDTLDYPFLARVCAGVCAAAWRMLQ